MAGPVTSWLRRNLGGRRLPGVFVVLCGLFAVSDALAVEAVGDSMGYRIFGESKKNRPLLLQNSRPHPVQVFEEARGVFVSVPPYSDRKLSCRGRERVLNVRFRDAFGDSLPFQIRISCGQEVQFVAPAQVAPVRPVAAPEAIGAEMPAEAAAPGIPALGGSPHDRPSPGAELTATPSED